MEKTTNKTEKNPFDSEILKNITEGLDNIYELIDTSFSAVDRVIDEKLSKKDAVNFKLFMDKFLKLKESGKHKEAEDLKNWYSEKYNQ